MLRALPSAFCLLLAFNGLGNGQATVQAGNDQVPTRTPQSAREVPTHSLNFESGQPIHDVSASPLIALPTECTPDGTMYLDMMSPSDPRRHTFVGITENSTSKFSTSLIDDLDDITVIGVSVSPSVFTVLIQATEKSQSLEIQGNEANSPHYYIAKFDLDGRYKGHVKLPVTGSLIRFAVFASGQFLVLSLDDRQTIPKLSVLTEDGELRRVLDTPKLLVDSSRKSGASSETPSMDEVNFLGAALLLPFRDGILAWRAGSMGPIIEVRTSGQEREIPVVTPSGYVLSDIVPASDRLIVHLKPATAQEGVAQDIANYAYYEVNPSDGTLAAKLTLSGASIGTVACEHDGEYISFHADGSQRLIRSVAR